jgi:uncharacterized protein YecT (DUF1311 family)
MKTILIPALFCLPFIFCLAQPQSDVINARDEYLNVDKALNKTYQKILSKYQGDSLFIKNLKKAQRIWIQFRDAELSMKFPNDVKDQYKDLPPVCISNYLTQLTSDRLRTLSVWIYGSEKGEDCAGSVKSISDISFDIPQILYTFEPDSTRWIILPVGINLGDVDLIEGEDVQKGKNAVVRFDLNADGNPEYFIRALCGNGGCEYHIYDGKTLRSRGELFGSPVWICEEKHLGFYSIMTYSHQSADSGNWTTYEFNGKEYKVTKSILLEGDNVKSLFDAIDSSSKTK